MDRLPTSVFLGFPGGSDRNEYTGNTGNLGLIPGLGRCPGGGHGQPMPVFLPGESHGHWNLVGYSIHTHTCMCVLIHTQTHTCMYAFYMESSLWAGTILYKVLGTQKTPSKNLEKG